jgi:carbon-monoxide dehydrogenase medium subunit
MISKEEDVMPLPAFKYCRPESLPELERLLCKNKGKAKILAGGTDLLVQMKGGIQNPAVLIDIGNIKSLKGILYEDGKGIEILAGTKIAELEASLLVRNKLYALYKAVTFLGSPQVRAMATLGGNICNASPCSDTVPILMALGSELVIAGNKSERRLPVESFLLDYRRVDLRAEEYLKSIMIPEHPKTAGSTYLCRMLRRAMEIDIVNVGLWLAIDKDKRCRDVRIALGSVAPIPMRARETEVCLRAQTLTEDNIRRAGDVASKEVVPIDDVRGSAEYRRQMVKILVIRAIKEVYNSIAD